jgi:hypothetical protein
MLAEPYFSAEIRVNPRTKCWPTVVERSNGRQTEIEKKEENEILDLEKVAYIFFLTLLYVVRR